LEYAPAVIVVVTAPRPASESGRRALGGDERERKTAAMPTPAGDDQRVRYTLDLSREQHRFLKRFAFDAETDASVVMRALLALLQHDERFARKVRAALDR
jgi:hypothetical protein